MADTPEPFFLRDQGDGWWNCPSPLRCTVDDGPGICEAFASIYPETPNNSRFWLVTVDPPIVWNGDRSGQRLGPDDTRYDTFGLTTKALVLAVEGDPFPAKRWWQRRQREREFDARWTDLDRDFSTPAYPVGEGARSVRDAQPMASLGAKASIYRGTDPYP